MSDTFSAESAPGCSTQSWSPEVISLYGDPDTVNEKLSKVEAALPERRVYVFVVEGERDMQVSLFERTDADKVSVTTWSGGRDEDIHRRMDQAILTNKGVNCVGEQTKAVLTGLSNHKTIHGVAPPANAKAAFSHQVRSRGQEYIRTTMYLMC